MLFNNRGARKRIRILFWPACGVREKNILTPEDTVKRGEAVLKLWKTGRYDYIFVSGGIFNPSNVQTIAASELMKKWLMDRGIKEQSILLESSSLDTYENISFFLEFIKKGELFPIHVTIVSQFQHCLRFFITFLLCHRRLITIYPLFYKISFKTFLLEWFMIAYHLYDWRGIKRVAVRNRDNRRQK